MLSVCRFIIKKALIAGIYTYKIVLSPLLGGHCRHVPSCSQYALDAVNKYPVYKSLFKIAGRILRCHPFSRGGWDPA